MEVTETELTHTAQRAGRLSSFLKKELGLSTALMNRLKWNGGILVDGRPEHTDFAVTPGMQITAVLDEPEPAYPAEDGELTILYEDAHLLAVDKPAGMLIHPSRAQFSGTLANRVAGYYRRTGQKCAFHPATRLDRDTFGVVLLAKNAYVHTVLNRLHEEGRLQKTYHAVVFGGPETPRGIIDAPIARKPLPSLLREIRPDGKRSVTEYAVVSRCGRCSVLALRPLTGRTHQLRLHCAYMGFPILGDPQYGSAESQAFSARLGIRTQLLCAYALELPHPVTGQLLRVQSRMDAEISGM